MRTFFKSHQEPRLQGGTLNPKPKLKLRSRNKFGMTGRREPNNLVMLNLGLMKIRLVSASGLLFSAFGRRPGRFWFILLLMVFISGCSFGSKTTYSVNQYTLEYPSPVFKETAHNKELIKVERFSVAQAFDTSAIVYRDGPHLRNIDPYNRWRTKPGEMVADFLIRDLRHSGLFQAVFSYNQTEETRYLLEGQVNEFLESKETDGLKAVLSLNITFLDLSKKEITERIVFQRDYRFTEPLERETYGSLAQAMSKAMENFSRQIMMDLYQAASASKK